MSNKKKKLELTLVKKLSHELQLTLDDNPEQYRLPNAVVSNLKHKLRPYQKEAMFFFQLAQANKNVDYKYNQLLFNMATGSGKTDIMAAIILYMYYKYHYQYFLFVANTNSVVSKTKNNFINSNSIKFLFNSPLVINGEHLDIKLCTQYPENPEDGIIYLKITTIQSLDNELTYPKENGLTYDQLKNKKLIVLADEAHHFNTATRSEKKLSHSWETVLNRIRYQNIKNRQFEFTATLNLKNGYIADKYANKIVYKYDLKQFQDDGYSKKIYRLQANNDDKDKMLNAVLVSQYRKEIARIHQIDNFKPVILFKSNTKKKSKHFKRIFNDLINNLSDNYLFNFINNQLNITHSPALKQVMGFFKNQNMLKVISLIQNDFQRMNIADANDNSTRSILSDSNVFYQLNSLEQSNNPIRAVFAVAKLNEGWDVLNLFDIVRLGEQPTTSHQTDSEAQLIGRGSRYYPFIYNNQKSYTRRFDNLDADNDDLQFLESLYYHTINQPEYLSRLQSSFDSINLQVENADADDYTYKSAKVKNSFKKTQVYKYGKVYSNEVEKIPDSEFDNIGKYNIKSNYEVNLIQATYEAKYDEQFDYSEKNDGKLIKIIDFNDNYGIAKKGISRNPFYRFDNLSKYVPTLNSLYEFITDNKWLGNSKIYARIDSNKDVSMHDKLKSVDLYLSYVQNKIVNNFRRKRGTRKFIPIPVKDIVHDYTKKVSNNFNNISINNIVDDHPMQKFKWFVYDKSIVDRLEQDCIDVIGEMITHEHLYDKYNHIYLLRNEETQNGLKLHQFKNNGVQHYEGYMPDFILYLSDDNFEYQIYIEPKGQQLINKDKWKQDLLESIKPENIEILGENKNIKLYGIKFYIKGNNNEFEEEFKKRNLL